MTWWLECCLCGETAGARQLVYVLDDEWLRRHPDANGRLACADCVASHAFDCADTSSAEHVPPPQPEGGDGRCDSWRLRDHGLVKAMVWEYPDSALQQGAREYLRFAVEKHRLPAELLARANQVLTSEPGSVE